MPLASISRNRRSVRKLRKKVRATVKSFLKTVALPSIRRQLTKALRDRGYLDKAAPPAEFLAGVLAELRFSDWEVLAEDLEAYLEAAAKDGVSIAFKQLSHEPTAEITDQLNQRALEYARERAAELVGMRRLEDGTLQASADTQWAITESTREMLRGTVREAIEEGWSTAQLAENLNDLYAFSDARAEAIARTEIARADVAGNVEAYRESGLVRGKVWILSDSHDVEDECDEAAAMGEVGIDEDFGGVGDPPAHPNCECDVLPVLNNEEE